MSGVVYPLAGEQADAVDPHETVWLSASAGTGKTQVLSARVLRLLLQPDVEPSQILCLTFTKAGAAEMAVRVNDVLARWVRMPDAALSKELGNIGAPVDPDTRSRARTLFASVLDCPGGGLRIDTIHAFSQWLLSAFPEEAGLVPGTTAMEDRDRELLAQDVLADLLRDAEQNGDAATLQSLAELSVRLGPDGAQSFLMRCAEAREAWFGPGAWQPPLRERVNQLLGLASDASEGDLAELCANGEFDVDSLRACSAINRQWSAKTGQANADAIDAWLARDPSVRADAIGELVDVFFTKAGALRASKSQDKIDPSYPDHVARVADSIAAAAEHKTLLELADFLDPALTLGRQFALKWDDAKQREGLIDFDDQIRRAAALLNRSEMADWIRFKLDRRFDHILVDEAQDTNAAQWRIIDALTDDFFAGEGAREGKLRTLFVVGDYKQAIFRFQGTSPENFRAAKDRVKARIEAALGNAAENRISTPFGELREYGLGRSFRTAQPVLDFVDRAIARIGPERFGLPDVPVSHRGEDRPGLVTLWSPVTARPDPVENGTGDESWIRETDRVLAERIARQVKDWMCDGFPLVKGEKAGTSRRAGPGDVMVLVRKRRELAGLIVARLYAAGVPVAGVDRLRLGAPLAVQDLMAGLRFAVQPDDDLSLANLLVSPLIGWSQDDLLECAYRAAGVRLWRHLRDSDDPRAAEAVAKLRDLLAQVDFETPQALLHWMLVGPWRGRAKLLARLGMEAADPIDELLNAAFAYESAHTASLQGFIQWFDAGEGELKREAEGAGDQVRVMTVHGSKGLQAPMVILADATGNPRPKGKTFAEALDLEERDEVPSDRAIPLPRMAKNEVVGRIRAERDKAEIAEMQEHWRLLYVAMTRAEEALFIGGALGQREDEPASDSWYAQLAPLFADAEPREDDRWGVVRELGSVSDVAPPPAKDATVASIDLPIWARTPIGPEPRPPRPLAPSSAGEDEAPDPPLPPGAGAEAARRGALIHAMLERLPEVRREDRERAAARWLARQAPDLPDDARDEMVVATLAVLDQQEWKSIFGPDALAEVPLAATVGGQVIAGTADRLLVEERRVLVVDFKTARRPPASLEEVPRATLRQMAAYVCALEAIYPDRAVEAAILYTQTPQLFALSDAMLAPHKAALQGAEESFTP